MLSAAFNHKEFGDAATLELVAELGKLFPKMDVLSYGGRRFLKGRDNPNVQTMTAAVPRLLSEKRSIDVAHLDHHSSLLLRIFYGASCVVIDKVIDRISAARPEDLVCCAGVWVDKHAFTVEYFAWAEVYRKADVTVITAKEST